MPDIQPDALVLEDAEGNYYVLPKELIELTKVEPDAKASVAEHLDDVSGFGRTANTGNGGSYRVLGRMRLPETNHWSKFSPNVGWPYYRPGPGINDRVNPRGRR